jgi:hypothetical protein
MSLQRRNTLTQRQRSPHLLAAVDVNTLEWASITGFATLTERHILSLFHENSLLGLSQSLKSMLLGTRVCAHDRAGPYSDSPADELNLWTTACRRSASLYTDRLYAHVLESNLSLGNIRVARPSRYRKAWLDRLLAPASRNIAFQSLSGLSSCIE